MKIGNSLTEPEAILLKGVIKEHLKNRRLQEGTILIETNYETGTIEFLDEDTGDALCLLPTHLFTTEFRDSKSISVKLVPSIELYEGTQYPRSFKVLLNIFIDDIVDLVRPEAGEYVITAECQNSSYITLAGNLSTMNFLDFIPKHFEYFLSSCGDDLDFIVKLEQEYKVNKK